MTSLQVQTFFNSLSDKTWGFFLRWKFSTEKFLMEKGFFSMAKPKRIRKYIFEWIEINKEHFQTGSNNQKILMYLKVIETVLFVGFFLRFLLFDLVWLVVFSALVNRHSHSHLFLYTPVEHGDLSSLPVVKLHRRSNSDKSSSAKQKRFSNDNTHID